MLHIKGGIFISEDELVFTASRSSGPGGQNVNKVNSRITAAFDIAANKSFSERDKELIFKSLASRIGNDGVLRVASQKYRTQNANRQAAQSRLIELLQTALKTKPIRHKTKPSYGAKQKRLEKKKRHSVLKQQRSNLPDL